MGLHVVAVEGAQHTLPALLRLGRIDHCFGADQRGVGRRQVQAEGQQAEHDQVADGFGEAAKFFHYWGLLMHG